MTEKRQVTVAIKDIRIDGGTQPRAEIDAGVVDDYAERMQAGDVFTPAEAVFDGSAYWLWDGFHRYHSAKKAGRDTLLCDVTDGTVVEAQWFSLTANKAHGLRRTSADIKKAVELALAHPSSKGMGDELIGKHIGVHRNTVLKYRNSTCTRVQVEDERLVNVDKSTDERTGRDGRTINTANIGKTKKPAPPDNGKPTAKRTSTPEPQQPEYDDVQRHPEDRPEVDIDDEATELPDEPEPPKKPPPAKGAGPVDAEGNPIPERLRDVFADTWLRDQIATLKESYQGIQIRPIVAGIQKRYKHFQYMRLTDAVEQLKAIDRAYETAMETLAQAVPYAVCLDCVGDSCDQCLHSGYLTQWKWEEVQREAVS